MRSLLAKLGLPEPGLLGRLAAEWDELAGPPWAGRSQPVYLRDKAVVVSVDDPGLVSMLRYATGELLERLDQRFGSGAVESIRVVSRRPD